MFVILPKPAGIIDYEPSSALLIIASVLLHKHQGLVCEVINRIMFG